MIENKTYKILIKTNDNYRKDFGINDDDYKQYAYVNFVTRDIKCYLHDGSYADPTIYNKNTDISDPDVKRRYDEFDAIMTILIFSSEYGPYFDEGDKYRQSHPDEDILMAQWVLDNERELKEHENDEPVDIPAINVNISNASTDYYVIPFSMNEYAYKQLYNACKNVLMNHPNWVEENKGYGYEHMLTEYKNSWFYIDNPSNNDNVSNDTVDSTVNHEGINDESDVATVNVKAILTVGFMSDKLILNVRFIMVDGKQLTQPSDVNMVMPFMKPEKDANDSDSHISSAADSTLDDDSIMQVCEQITSKLDDFIISLMSTVD